ncbi:MAG TPA: MerR family transcriptional regulator [Candidatus Aminicenantes bacterium]|nr:MerR family transcriptional regulator [Candidatus Aminicenantes bacterium]
MDEERKRKQAGEEKRIQEGDSNFYQKKNNQEATFAESKAGGRTGASKKTAAEGQENESDQKIPKKYYHISAVSRMYDIHPQTLRLYEREGLLRPTRSEGNTRLYTDEDLQRLEVILTLTRDLGVNLAGVEIILNMREKMARLEEQINHLFEYVRREFFEGREDEFEAKKDAIIRISPVKVVKWIESERLTRREKKAEGPGESQDKA